MVGEASQTLAGLELAAAEVIKPGPIVAILDAGAQYGLDIEQQTKRLGYNAVRLPFDTPIEILYDFGAIILSGGPEDVNDPASPRTDPRLFTEKDRRPPVLGICYGNQLINHELGGKVEKLDKREDGYTLVNLGASALSANVEVEQRFIMSHGLTVTKLAPGFQAIAYSDDLIAGIANDEERMYGVQFHPEVSPPAGPELLRHFLHDIAELDANYEYTYEQFIQDAVSEAREFIGNKPVILYLSGGVDSSAAAKLLELAIPKEQLHFVLVDHGFMREGEIEKVTSMLAEADISITVLNATDFYEKATTFIDGVETAPLDEVIDPEVKRKIIGDTFINIQKRMAAELGIDEDEFILVMGSLYTDLIESGSKLASDHADTVKSHHNDTELVRQMRDQGRVYEPWRFIQKDDVRAVGKLLGLPEEIYNRQPFPGPGVAVRIICADEAYVTEENPWIKAQLREFSTDEIEATLLPIPTVGIQGDERTYGHLAGLSGKRDWVELKRLADTIPRKVHGQKMIDGKLQFFGVNRVAYIFGNKIEGEVETVTPTRVSRYDAVPQQKMADAIVMRKLEEYGLDKTITQVPVILTPIDFNRPGKRSVAIRTFNTINFKVGDIAVPGVDFPEHVLLEIVEELMTLPWVERVLYDLTSKPPGTVEWE